MDTTFAGIIPPMLTPLTPDERIDCAAVERLVYFLIGHGVHGLFILGSIGEGAFLRPTEKRALAEATIAAARGRVPVIAGVLEPGTEQVIEGMRLRALPGIAAYVVTTPYYYGGFPTASLREHFFGLVLTCNVGCLVLVVMQLHCFLVIIWLQCIVCIGQRY